MRSWSKWVIFSRMMKSSSSDGPRAPAFRLFWLSATFTPWLVRKAWPVASLRNASRLCSLALVLARSGVCVPAASLCLGASVFLLVMVGSPHQSSGLPSSGSFK
ncbi:hypothetical protein D3C81_2008760 [compost metagenome]